MIRKHEIAKWEIMYPSVRNRSGWWPALLLGTSADFGKNGGSFEGTMEEEVVEGYAEQKTAQGN